MEIELTKKQKIALLESVQKGILDTKFIEDAINKREDETTLDEINQQMIHVEVIEGQSNPSGFIQKAELMMAFAKHEISESEYIRKRMEQEK